MNVVISVYVVMMMMMILSSCSDMILMKVLLGLLWNFFSPGSGERPAVCSGVLCSSVWFSPHCLLQELRPSDY